MMLIPTRVGPSRIHGNGLFAASPVPKGTPVWRFEPGFDRKFSATEFNYLPEIVRQHLRWFAFLSADDGAWNLSGDHACFMNHSDQPNTGAGSVVDGPVTTVALLNLDAGTELTCNYRAFDSEAAAKLRTD